MHGAVKSVHRTVYNMVPNPRRMIGVEPAMCTVCLVAIQIVNVANYCTISRRTRTHGCTSAIVATTHHCTNVVVYSTHTPHYSLSNCDVGVLVVC